MSTPRGGANSAAAGATAGAPAGADVGAVTTAGPVLRADISPWAVQLASIVPLGAAIIAPPLVGTVRQTGWYVTLALAAVALGAVGLHEWWRSTRAGESGHLWRPWSAMLAVALLVPYLVVAVALPEELIVLLLAGVLVSSAFANPPAWRLPFGLFVVVVWLLLLVVHGSSDPTVLLLHATGGLLLLALSLRTSTAMARAVAAEAELRAMAERRTRILADLLTVSDLDPAVVLGAVDTVLRDVGFDLIVVRRLSADGAALELVAGTAPPGSALPPRLPTAHGPAAEALRTGRPVRGTGLLRSALVAPASGSTSPVGAATPDGSGAERADSTVVAVPIRHGDEVVGVVSAVSLDGSVGADVDATVVPLMDQLGRAVARAQAFTADRDTIAELVELDRQVHDLVATISHELRTPLTVVQGLGQTLTARWDELPPVRRADLLDRIEANAHRLEAMLGSLLDTSALENGELGLQQTPVTLRELIADSMHRLAHVAATHPVHLDVPPELEVSVDVSALTHVLDNLLTNIDKHTPQGTAVYIRAEPCDPDRVLVTIADEGPGIAATDLPHVAERFYRGGDHLQRASSGLGLGLTVVQRVLDAHGSQLQVLSEDGRGAAFRFLLPRGRCGDPVATVQQLERRQDPERRQHSDRRQRGDRRQGQARDQGPRAVLGQAAGQVTGQVAGQVPGRGTAQATAQASDPVLAADRRRASDRRSGRPDREQQERRSGQDRREPRSPWTPPAE